MPLPPEHHFSMEKYRLLRDRLVAKSIAPLEDFVIPHAATDEEITRAHSPDYLRKIVSGDLTPQELRRLSLPWSMQLVERARHKAWYVRKQADYFVMTPSGSFSAGLSCRMKASSPAFSFRSSFSSFAFSI